VSFPLPGDDVFAACADAFVESGFPRPTATRMAEAMEEGLDSIIDERCAQVLSQILSKLGDCAAGQALKNILLGSDESRSKQAERIGCSRQAILKHEQTIAVRLGIKVTPPATVETKNV
jgi:hypothetical protein